MVGLNSVQNWLDFSVKKNPKATREFIMLLQVFSSSLERTVSGLAAGQPYSFCVTAVTIVGEGGCGRVVVETPRLPHKPLISSLSRHYDALINTATSLTCRSVGNPRPTTGWTWK